MLFSKPLLNMLFLALAIPLIAQAHRSPSHRVKSDAARFQSSLLMYEAENNRLPSAQELNRMLDNREILFGEDLRVNDIWGTPYDVHFDHEGDGQIVCRLAVTDQLILQSAGGDKVFGTEDDLFSVDHSGYQLKRSPLNYRLNKRIKGIVLNIPFRPLLILTGGILWVISAFFTLTRRKTRERWMWLTFALTVVLILGVTHT